jgi:hypothetical protein
VRMPAIGVLAVALLVTMASAEEIRAVGFNTASRSLQCTTNHDYVYSDRIGNEFTSLL